MKYKNSIYNDYFFINTLEINELIRSIKENKNIIKIGNIINYDLIFEYINNGYKLSTVIQEITNQVEKYIIVDILKYTYLNKSKAARILKINYKTLYYKIKKYSI